MMDIIEKIEQMAIEGLRISSVYLEPERGGQYVAIIGISNWLPLGEGGDLPHHLITVDRQNLPPGISIIGGEKHQDERIQLGLLNSHGQECMAKPT